METWVITKYYSNNGEIEGSSVATASSFERAKESIKRDMRKKKREKTLKNVLSLVDQLTENKYQQIVCGMGEKWRIEDDYEEEWIICSFDGDNYVIIRSTLDSDVFLPKNRNNGVRENYDE